MGNTSYAFNEDKMLASIAAYRAENKINPAENILPVSMVKKAPSEEIIYKVANMYKITPEAILSNCREHYIVKAREVIVLILRRRYGYSLTRIGSILGRHHTSVMYLEEQGNKHYGEHPSLRQLVDDIVGVSLCLKRDAAGLPL